ncbi:hypothetical protein Bbelb_008500 [Branchiostoma belcheri]|nr:hypothetical protein Bbelb_008500 [Branchiostoma belcheri]
MLSDLIPPQPRRLYTVRGSAVSAEKTDAQVCGSQIRSLLATLNKSTRRPPCQHSSLMYCNLVSEPKPDRPRVTKRATTPINGRTAMEDHAITVLSPLLLREFCHLREPPNRLMRQTFLTNGQPAPPPLLPGFRLLKKSRGRPLTNGMTRKHNTINRPAMTSDILICGRCKDMFSTLERLRHHKLVGCRPHPSCPCGKADVNTEKDTPFDWVCRFCQQAFDGPWPLMQHASAVHNNTIYSETGQDPGTLLNGHHQAEETESSGSLSSGAHDEMLIRPDDSRLHGGTLP